jgi:hypothetical protein
MGADGIIYNNVYDNGYDNNQVILSHKLHVPSNKKGSKIHIKKKNARGWSKKHQGGGPVEPSAYNRAVYSSVNPLWGIPDNFF